jgi:hypothetical protein
MIMKTKGHLQKWARAFEASIWWFTSMHKRRLDMYSTLSSAICISAFEHRVEVIKAAFSGSSSKSRMNKY